VDEYVTELRYERSMKDQFMARHRESPFVAEAVPGFEGLQYFEIDLKYRVPAKLERRGIPEEAYLRTNRDGQATMRYIGDLCFQLGGRSLRLRVYHAGEGVGTSVFVPFRDSTSGTESYGPGRYLTFELNENDEYDLDFNRAFNPYCAYTDAYECGFPPAENDLPVPVRAGEKAWSQQRNPATPSTAVRQLLDRVSPPKPKAKPKPAARAVPGRSRPRRRLEVKKTPLARRRSKVKVPSRRSNRKR
jgi:uncharacterized protein (DUF1684 family)